MANHVAILHEAIEGRVNLYVAFRQLVANHVGAYAAFLMQDVDDFLPQGINV